MKNSIQIELNRLREDIKSCDIVEVTPLIQPMGISMKGNEKNHLLSHVDQIDKLIEIANRKIDAIDLDVAQNAYSYILSLLDDKGISEYVFDNESIQKLIDTVKGLKS